MQRKNTLRLVAVLATVLLVLGFAHVPALAQRNLVRNSETASGTPIYCGGGFFTKKVDRHPLPQQDADTTILLRCDQLAMLGQAFWVTGQWKESYDTLKYYFERCANDSSAWREFDDIRIAQGNYSSRLTKKRYDSTQYAEFREWLKSVLYLNTWDPYYYCWDLWVIAQTYGNDNSACAVLDYLIHCSRCSLDSSDHKMFIDDYKSARADQWDNYMASTSDTSLVHLDTTLPSLHDLGLDSLLELAGVGAGTVEPHSIFSASASTNPFHLSTEVEFELSSTAYVQLEIYDELGRNVHGEEMGHVYGPGRHKLVVDGKNLPSGVYYARLSTPTGETRTLKLVKKD